MFDIQPEGFYERLEAAIGRPIDDEDKDFLNISLRVERPATIARYREDGEDPRGLYTEYIPLEHVAARLAEQKIGHWLYDRRLKLWFINLNRGAHEHLMGTLYRLYTGADLWAEEAAEKYILEHYGFFVSGSMNCYIPIKDDHCVLTPEEAIFEKAKGQLAWRGI